MRYGQLLAAGLLGTVLMGASEAQAALTFTIEQVGSDVVTTGSGSADITDLTFNSISAAIAGIDANLPYVSVGTLTVPPVDVYNLPTSLPLFGSGVAFAPDSGSGDRIDVQQNLLILPLGYVSGGALSATDTFDNQTLASLGLTPGTYTLDWGTGVHADSFVLQIGPAATVSTPEPASLALLGAGLAGLGFIRRRKRAI